MSYLPLDIPLLYPYFAADTLYFNSFDLFKIASISGFVPAVSTPSSGFSCKAAHDRITSIYLRIPYFCFLAIQVFLCSLPSISMLTKFVGLLLHFLLHPFNASTAVIQFILTISSRDTNEVFVGSIRCNLGV